MQFERLMYEIASKPINIFLDFNAVVVNLTSLSPEGQKLCLENIKNNVKTLISYLEDNIRVKESIPQIPETGMAVLRQQLILSQAIEKWVDEISENQK